MSEKLLEIKDERLSFFTPAGEVKALNGVSFSMEEGEVLGIVGESGSGKSVTAYSIMGLTAYPGKLIGGTIRFNGHQVDQMTEREFRKMRGNEVSIIFQDPMTSLNPVYTIGNQIMEVIRLHTDKTPEQAKDRARELLELVGINEPEKRLRQYPHELSGGMRQRVMIAIALACEPKLLIADEPTTALDVTIQAQILELMQELRQKMGMSIIMITHDLGVVASMCERIAVMYAGHIVEYGTTDEIFYEPSHEYTKGLINSIPKLSTEASERLVPIEGQPVDLLRHIAARRIQQDLRPEGFGQLQAVFIAVDPDDQLWQRQPDHIGDGAADRAEPPDSHHVRMPHRRPLRCVHPAGIGLHQRPLLGGEAFGQLVLDGGRGDLDILRKPSMGDILQAEQLHLAAHPVFSAPAVLAPAAGNDLLRHQQVA